MVKSIHTYYYYCAIIILAQMLSLTVSLAVSADGSITALPEAATSCMMKISSASGAASGNTLTTKVPDL